MSDSESLDYLQEDFDPRSTTVPRLRSLLVKHNIQYPSNAKKPQLVELFNDHIVPQAKSILARNAKAKRSSYGIVNAGSYEDLNPPKSARRSGSPRKSSARVKNEDFDEPMLSPTYSRQSRSASRQLYSDAESAATPTARRRSRRSTATPGFKFEEPEPLAEVMADEHGEDEEDDEDVFSSDNPFQSGSSPPPIRTLQTPNGRRKTSGLETTRTPRSSTRRRTHTPAYESEDDGKDPGAYEMPIARTRRMKSPEPVEIEVGEEFTPEEQLEMQMEEMNESRANVVPRRQRGGMKAPFWLLITALLVAYGAWYRQEKIAVGYCGLGRRGAQLLPDNVPVPDWAVPFLEAQCEPCPHHATCFRDFVARCDTDFILQPHPLSFGGLVPLPPTCEPDGEKVRRVKAVADKAVEELRERRAQYECGGTITEDAKPVETPSMEVEELKETVSRKRNKRLNKQDFDDLWAAALGEIKDREEIVVEETTDSGGISNTHLSSTSLARVPLACAVKRSIINGLERHKLSIGSVIFFLIAAAYGRSRYIAERAAAARVPGLVDLVLDRLSKQKENSMGDELAEPWLFLPNLRDDVLRSIHSLSKRDKLWQKVRAVVEQNSNVRTGQRESQNGEVGKAWEWIGPMSGDGARRRKSGRVSWGADINEEDVKGGVSEYKDKAHSKWEESRPIY